MWKDRCKFRKRPRNNWIFENTIAGDDSLGAFSGICFNASTVSGFALTFVDLSIKLNFWLDWYETWNSLGNLLKFQRAHFLVFTETERTFVVSITFEFHQIIHWFKTAACFVATVLKTIFKHLIFIVK